MSVISWLTARLKVNINSALCVKDIYDTFIIEEIMVIEKKIGIDPFSVLIQKTFKIAPTRKKVAGKRQSTYQLIWNSETYDFKQPIYSTSALLSVLPKDFHIVEQDDTQIVTTINTGVLSNSNSIQMKVTFNISSLYQVSIRGKEISLQENYISTKFQCSETGLNNVVKQLKAIQLCEGILKDKNNVEQKENYYFETLTIKDTTKVIIRSKQCKQVAPLTTSKAIRCNSCRRMKIFEKEKQLCPEEQLRKLMPGASDTLLTLIFSQIKNSNNTDAKQNRWDKNIIKECLSWYTRSPQSYLHIRQSGLLILPSPSILLLYKNSVSHSPGLDNDIFMWMEQEANRLAIPEYGRVGGLLLDEMSIQQKLDIHKKGKGMEMVGFVDCGEETDTLGALRRGSKKKSVGTHILQFYFQGLTGFRFPFAHFVSSQVCAADLYILVWDSVTKLNQFGFDIKYISMDGAMSNRQFMKIHFSSQSAISSKMRAPMPCNPSKSIIFIMDPSHTMKKIRNNIIKSGVNKMCTRSIVLPSGNSIQWQMWIDAYQWDKVNPIQIHRRLRNEHIFPSSSEKMRNQLAEDALDGEMLNLMTAYQDYLGQKGQALDGAIELLYHTSTMIDFFRDKRPIIDINDARLMKLNEAQLWFLNWENKSNSSKDIMSYQCHEDVQSSLIGLQQLCQDVFIKYPGFSIIPSQINSDAIENIFCQQRGKLNGLNTNPTALQYQQNINSLILGQSLISKKSNAQNVNQTATNYTYAIEKPLRKSIKRKRSDINLKSVKCLRM